MKKLFIGITVCFFYSNLFAQNITLDSLHTFSSELIENSGLIFFEDKLITHTDSGGENALYEIDTLDLSIQRKIFLKNAVNIDWEDIAHDNDYIYLADFGNNSGNRTNLKILIVDKFEFETTINDTIENQEISFSYEDQTDFTAANQNTNFDAEALLVFEDSLYIFTKNWINQETNVYVLSKDTGTQVAKYKFSYDVNGLVTGADYDKINNKIFLCGYTKLASPFIYEMDSFSLNQFFSGANTRHSVDMKGSTQIEGICKGNGSKIYVSSEKFFTAESILHSFIDSSMIVEVDTITAVDSVLFIEEINQNIEVLFPNPVQDIITLTKEIIEIEIYDIKGKCISKTESRRVDIKNLEKGYYFLRMKNENNSYKTIKFKK